MKEGWEIRSLGEVCEKTKNIKWQDHKEETFKYVDLSSVSRDTLKINSTTIVNADNAPSRAKKIIHESDVIFATTRPTLKRVTIISPDFNNQICSTGFTVLRPQKKEIDGEFIFYFLQSGSFMNRMEKLQRGASYPAVTDSDVKKTEIPIPPLPEQRAIVALLDAAFAKIDQAQAHIEKNIANARELFQSIFAAKTNPDSNDWKMVTVQQVAKNEKGSMRTGPFGSQLLHKEFVDEGIAVLGIDNAVANEFQWRKERYITPEKFQQLKRFQVKPRDVLITIMGTCGRCAIVPDDIPVAINTKHLCCITLDQNKCLSEYLHAYFLYHPIAQHYLKKNAKGAIMAGLNMGIIKEMPLLLPPIEEQKIIIELLMHAQRGKQDYLYSMKKKLQNLSDLKKSLLQKAFAGELTEAMIR